MKKILSVVLFFIILSFPAFSSEKVKIVVVDLVANGVSNKIASNVSKMLRAEFKKIGLYTIIEMDYCPTLKGPLKYENKSTNKSKSEVFDNRIKSMLTDESIKQAKSTDLQCAKQIGQLVSARKVIVGMVSSKDNSISTTVRMFDVNKSTFDITTIQKSKSKDYLDVAVSLIVKKLKAKIK